MLVAFWAAVTAVVHTYAGFPLVVAVRARVAGRPHARGDATPPVSVIIAARNEAVAIGAKLDTLLACDYPEHLRQVVVASDGSEDATATIVAGYADRGVDLLDLPRVGKAAALNAAVARTTGEIVVFTDANSLFDRDALRHLVAPFADPEVGGVAGDQRYLPEHPGDAAGGAQSGGGERRYWDLDRALKQAESRAGNVISATGAIYAIRRDLVTEVPEGVTDDFATSTAVIAQGHRLVFSRDAVAWEPVAESTSAEFERKVRVMTRGLRAVALRRELLDPRRSGFYAYQLLTHKVLRRMMAVPLATLFVTAPALWRRGLLYRLAAVGQPLLYGAGLAGIAAPASRLGRSPLCSLPAYFCMANAAGMKAAWNVLRGNRIDRWEPRRGELVVDTGPVKVPVPVQEPPLTPAPSMAATAGRA